MRLKIRNVVKKFGALVAVNNVSLDVNENSLLGIIGPNGAGKTTLFNIITGVYPPDGGAVFLNGDNITSLKPHEIVEKGLGRTFQIPRIFFDMTVLENMLVPIINIKISRNKERKELEEKALEILNKVRLVRLKDMYGEGLSGGQQKLLEFARVLMLDPKVILLDEPFAGVDPVIKEQIKEMIIKRHSEGTTLVMISHDIPSIMEVCEEVAVLSAGKLIVRGKPKEVARDKRVIEAYLGA